MREAQGGGRLGSVTTLHYLGDFRTGDTFDLGSWSISPKDALEFCERYDPQDQWLDPALREPLHGGVVISGMQLLAELQRRLVADVLNQTAHHGVRALGDVEFGPPARAGTALDAEFSILGLHEGSLPDRGDVFGRAIVSSGERATPLSAVFCLVIARKPPPAH